MQVKNKINHGKNAQEELVQGPGDGSDSEQMHLLHKASGPEFDPQNPLIVQV